MMVPSFWHLLPGAVKEPADVTRTNKQTRKKGKKLFLFQVHFSYWKKMFFFLQDDFSFVLFCLEHLFPLRFTSVTREKNVLFRSG
jgi:hypothetical protein